MTTEKISEQMDQHETAERCWRLASYIFAGLACGLFLSGLAGALFMSASGVATISFLLMGVSCPLALLAWLFQHKELVHVQNQRVLDWDYFNANDNEDELEDLRTDVIDLQSQVREKNRMIRDLTEPKQTVCVRSVTALAALPR